MLATPAAAELSGLVAAPGIPAEQNVAGQPGNPRSFVAAMQALDNPHGDEGSGSLLPPGLVVTGAEPTVPASMLDLALPTLPDTPMTTESAIALPDEVVNPNLSAGSSLPEEGSQIGNILPSIAAHSGSQPSLSSEGSVTTLTASTIQLQQAVTDPTQVALASVTTRSMLPDGQLQPDARTPGPTSISADEPASLASQINAMPEPELELVSRNQVQRTFESIAMYSESTATGRTAENIAAMSADSGPVAFAQSSPQAPLQFNQLMDLPQFQNMRPLQPTADPKVFMEGLGQRLMVMSNEGVQSARLKLYPENLGTLDIKIQVEDNVARVWFTAEHGQAREALEAALPKLKELFSQQGMELIQADVDSSSDRRQASEAFSHADDLFMGNTVGESDSEGEPILPSNIMALSERRLDIYV